MRTKIAKIDDDLNDRAKQQAARLGISRQQFINNLVKVGLGIIEKSGYEQFLNLRIKNGTNDDIEEL